MMKAPSYTMTNESISVVWQGKAYTVQKTAPNFLALKKALAEENWDQVEKNLTIKRSVEAWSNEKFKIDDGVVLYNDQPLPDDLTRRILDMVSLGTSPEPFFNFWERLQKNPSFRSVQQLWKFLEHEHIPLTDDGCFMAYKGVRYDYKDKHSGTFLNTPGSVHEMPRNKISDDPKVPCHDGFHVGALAYAKSFGDRLVVCKIDPEHVVCVPYDQSSQKMRVCKYEVMGNFGSELPSTHFPSEKMEEDEPEQAEEGELEQMEIELESEAGGATTEKPAKAKSSTPVKPKAAAKKKYAKFTKMDTDKLLQQSLDDLRKYATYGLVIVGASKIPGGKVALVHRILDVRRKPS